MNDNIEHHNSNTTSNYMISFDDALKLISSNSQPIKNEVVALENASNRILAEDVFSPISVPTFNNSAMDGYAVNAADLKNADKNNPIVLKVIGVIAAGDNIAEAETTSQCAWKIMTGAPVPEGFNSIVPVENTVSTITSNNTKIECFSAPMIGAHIRSSGEDFQHGDSVLKVNSTLNSNRIMALAALGIAKVSVKKKPKIAVFSTGKELVDDLESSLKPGQIYDSNMPYILSYLNDLPVNAHSAGTNYDQADLYETALQKELDSGVNIIISTGAVSMGDFDFIPQTILKMGGKIIFHKSKIRPGKPILFAKFPNGSYYFGLPGNPISAAVGLRFFVTYLINELLELPPEMPLKAVLNKSSTKKKGFRTILKANVQLNSNACVSADIMQGQESFKIHPLIDSNAWIVLAENLETIEGGSLVDYYPSSLAFR